LPSVERGRSRFSRIATLMPTPIRAPPAPRRRQSCERMTPLSASTTSVCRRVARQWTKSRSTLGTTWVASSTSTATRPPGGSASFHRSSSPSARPHTSAPSATVAVPPAW
jgi:hypothetical protein